MFNEFDMDEGKCYLVLIHQIYKNREIPGIITNFNIIGFFMNRTPRLHKHNHEQILDRIVLNIETNSYVNMIVGHV